MKNVAKIMYLTLLLFTVTFTTSIASEGKQIELFPDTGDDYSRYISNYSWAPDGLTGNLNILYQLGNLLFVGAVFLIKFAISILNLGLHPTFLSGIFQGVADAITSSKTTFLPRVIPFAVIIAGAVLVWDFTKNDPRTAMKRGVNFLVICGMLGLYYNFTAPGIKMASDALDATTNMFSNVVVSIGVSPDERNQDIESDAINIVEDKVQNIVWKLLVDHPWQMGEFNEIDAVITEEEAKKLDNELKLLNFIVEKFGWIFGLENNAQIKFEPGSKWRDYAIQHPPDVGYRALFSSYYEKYKPEKYYNAYSGLYRLLLGLLSFIGAVIVGIFMTMFGAILISLYLLFIVAILAGGIILPLSLIPFNQNSGILRWLVQVLLGTVVGKIAIGIYIGLVFLVVIIKDKAMYAIGDDSNYTDSFLISLLLNLAIFLIAIILFIFLLKKYQPNITKYVKGKNTRSRSDDDENSDEDEDDSSRGKSKKNKVNGSSGYIKHDTDRSGRNDRNRLSDEDQSADDTSVHDTDRTHDKEEGTNDVPPKGNEGSMSEKRNIGGTVYDLEEIRTIIKDLEIRAYQEKHHPDPYKSNSSTDDAEEEDLMIYLDRELNYYEQLLNLLNKEFNTENQEFNNLQEEIRAIDVELLNHKFNKDESSNFVVVATSTDKDYEVHLMEERSKLVELSDLMKKYGSEVNRSDLEGKRIYNNEGIDRLIPSSGSQNNHTILDRVDSERQVLEHSDVTPNINSDQVHRSDPENLMQKGSMSQQVDQDPRDDIKVESNSALTNIKGSKIESGQSEESETALPAEKVVDERLSSQSIESQEGAIADIQKEQRHMKSNQTSSVHSRINNVSAPKTNTDRV